MLKEVSNLTYRGMISNKHLFHYVAHNSLTKMLLDHSLVLSARLVENEELYASSSKYIICHHLNHSTNVNSRSHIFPNRVYSKIMVKKTKQNKVEVSKNHKETLEMEICYRHFYPCMHARRNSKHTLTMWN